MQDVIFSNPTIEFVKISLEYCALMEKSKGQEKQEFIDQLVKALPLLYLKATVIPEIEENYDSDLENGVSEAMYDQVLNGVEELLGEDNLYLETFHPDIKYSDSPIAVKLSEDLADIYQDLGNFISIFKNGNKETMNDSLTLCLQNFKDFWGQRLVNAFRALHHLKYDNKTEAI